MVGPPRRVTTTMNHPVRQRLPRAQLLTEHLSDIFRHFLHQDAVAGAVLIAAAGLALIWANSSFSSSYHAFWHLPISLSIGDFNVTESLHFFINDGLMTLFFLVVGMEIRREIYDGALSDIKQAVLPAVAAVGGVVMPALIYVVLNTDAVTAQGWAVPTATDIAFAVGVLALLGKGIPTNVRIFLLALAIIDDIIAVLIIAFFYSGGLEVTGFFVAAAGIFLVLLFQRMGFGSLLAYAFPSAVVWYGLLITGAHPTLAGVVLGLLTPVQSLPTRGNPLDSVANIGQKLRDYRDQKSEKAVVESLRQLKLAQREVLAPVVRVQMVLHPWVVFGIMPIFALANAGVSLHSLDVTMASTQWVMLGTALALVLGKPLGIVGVSWLMVRLGFCQLPQGVSWSGIMLGGLLAGIGFTMSIFIAMLAFESELLLIAAKAGVLIGSILAATLGIVWGLMYKKKLMKT